MNKATDKGDRVIVDGTRRGTVVRYVQAGQHGRRTSGYFVIRYDNGDYSRAVSRRVRRFD